MRIAACVILYYPDTSVKNNIHTYIYAVEKIYVIDNSETKQINLGLLSAHNSKIFLITDGNNDGIAKRLNQACSLAIEDGYDLLLTMDQDSYFEKPALENYFKCVTSYTSQSKIAMFGVNYQKQVLNNNCNYNNVKHLITSGSIIDLNTYKQIGGFNEELFIDFVDTDYCFKSVLAGYELIEFPNTFMHHKIGEITLQRSLKNLKSTHRSIHSSLRLYYMIRNFLYINKKYKNDFKAELYVFKKDLQNRIKNKLLYNKGRLNTFKLIIKAWKDFKKQQMGKQLAT